MLGMISCKEATYLTVKKEEKSLTLSERLKLRIHMLLCKVCALFGQQSHYISTQAKQVEEQCNPNEKLDDTIKQKLEKELK